MASRTVTVVLAAIGGVVLLGSGATAAIAGVNTITTTDASDGVDVSGVQNLDAEVSGAELRIEFHDGDDARLQSERGSLAGWTLQVDEDSLEVRSPNRGGWFGRWFDGDLFGGDLFGGNWFGDHSSVVLMLPQSMAGADADLTLNSGSLLVSGEFGELEADASAGRMTLVGTASSVDLSMSAGAVDVDVENVSEAIFEVAAGRLDAALTGTAPKTVELDVSAGQLNLTLPEGKYDVRQDVTAGKLDNDLSHDSSSSNVVSVSVSAGLVNLRQG